MNRFTRYGLGVMGALLGLGGCAMEVADPSEEVGLATQALRTAWAGLSPTGTPTALREVASCRISPSEKLVAGGALADGTPSANVWLYNSSTNTWTQKESLPAARKSGLMFKVPGQDRCVFLGGSNSDEIYVYDLDNDTASPGDGWTDLADELSAPREHMAIGRLTASKFLVFGGSHTVGGRTVPRTVDLIDVSSATISSYTSTAINAGGNVIVGRDFLKVVELDGPDVDGVNTIDFYVSGGVDAANSEASTFERVRVKENGTYVSTTAMEGIGAVGAGAAVATSKFCSFRIDGFLASPEAEQKTAAKILVAAGEVGTDGTAQVYAFEPSIDADGEWYDAPDMLDVHVRPEQVEMSTESTFEAAPLTPRDVLCAGGTTDVATAEDNDTVAFSQTWNVIEGRWYDNDKNPMASFSGIDGRAEGFSMQFINATESNQQVPRVIASHGAYVFDGVANPMLSTVEKHLP